MNSDFWYHKHIYGFCIMAKGNLTEDVILLQVGYGERHLHYFMRLKQFMEIEKILE